MHSEKIGTAIFIQRYMCLMLLAAAVFIQRCVLKK